MLNIASSIQKVPKLSNWSRILVVQLGMHPLAAWLSRSNPPSHNQSQHLS